VCWSVSLGHGRLCGAGRIDPASAGASPGYTIYSGANLSSHTTYSGFGYLIRVYVDWEAFGASARHGPIPYVVVRRSYTTICCGKFSANTIFGRGVIESWRAKMASGQESGLDWMTTELGDTVAKKGRLTLDWGLRNEESHDAGPAGERSSTYIPRFYPPGVTVLVRRGQGSGDRGRCSVL
jgi:hypothetical protein